MSGTRAAGAAMTIVLAALVAALLAPTASAYVPPSGDPLPVRITDTYRGWGYIANEVDVTAWKWTAAGWQKATLVPGQSVWAHPWGGGWTWAYRDAQWYAVSTRFIARWSCIASGRTIRSIDNVNYPAFRYNDDDSVLNADGSLSGGAVGYAAHGSSFELLCENGFPDARVAPGAYLPVSDAECALLGSTNRYCMRECTWGPREYVPAAGGGAAMMPPPCDYTWKVRAPRSFVLVRGPIVTTECGINDTSLETCARTTRTVYVLADEMGD